MPNHKKKNSLSLKQTKNASTNLVVAFFVSTSRRFLIKPLSWPNN